MLFAGTVLHNEVAMQERIRRALEDRRCVMLTQELMHIDSTNPPGNERAVAEAIARWSQDRGLRATVDAIDDDRANVMVRLVGRGEGPALLYCGHLDTVPIGTLPWDHDPFGGEAIDGWIWGRGAVDMKGGVAALLAAMSALREAGSQFPGDVVFAGVAGEEVDCIGSRRFLAQGGMADVAWLVIAEPTNLDVVAAHKGALRLQVTAYGRAAHGAAPELGVNAIIHMLRLLDRVTGQPLPAPPHALLSASTLSVNTINGGIRPNIVPDRCQAVLDIRTLPGQEHQLLRSRFSGIATDLARELPDVRIDVDILNEAAPVDTRVDHPLILAAQRTVSRVLGRNQPAVRGVSYFSDASVLCPPTHVPTLIFGPGDEQLAHQRNERVAAEDLVHASQVLALLPFEIFSESGTA